MPKMKYEQIYKDLKQKIEGEEYPYQEFLPSENTLVQIYHCSRNTVRRAIGALVRRICPDAPWKRGAQYFPPHRADLLYDRWDRIL